MQEIFGDAASGTGGMAAGAGNGSMIKDTTTATFAADVLEASMTVPVIVDFWAPWCGPCKQLGPMLEKAVKERAGAVAMVKLNIDENPEIAQQLRIQSIPAVFAFVKGQPIDGFAGALPESQIKTFLERVIKAGGGEVGPTPIEQALEAAAEMLAQGDVSGAGALYGQVLQQQPDNLAAIAGMAQCYLQTGQPDAAERLIQALPENKRSDPGIAAVIASMDLAEKSQEAVGRTGEFGQRLQENPNDHEARLELALAAYAQNDAERAIDELIEIVRRDRNWNEDAARKELVKIFDALGATHPATVDGRQKLSSVLFA
ncbi:MAG: thioredoxin [Alphaproteobacteria bacterium]|nr:thioredoxin [Alphaproteobacteria bacterium]